MAAEVRTDHAECSSACGFALIGTAERHVAPDAKLGIHGPRLSVRIDGYPVPPSDPRHGEAMAIKEAASKLQVLHYAIEMGIDRGYVDAIFSVPRESLRYLKRSEVVRFGIDARPSPESPWQIRETNVVAVMKSALRPQAEGRIESNVRLDLACTDEGRIGVRLVREIADANEGQDAVEIANGAIGLTLWTTDRSRPTAHSTHVLVETRLAYASPEFFDQAERGGTIILTETPVMGASGRAARVTALSTAGLAGLRRASSGCRGRPVSSLLPAGVSTINDLIPPSAPRW